MGREKDWAGCVGVVLLEGEGFERLRKSQSVP